MRRKPLPVLTETDVRCKLRPHTGNVKGEGELAKLDRMIRLQYIAPIREAMGGLANGP